MNIIAVDQEGKSLAVITNGDLTIARSYDEISLPDGGGIVVGDTNVWAVANDYSQSQFAFESEEARQATLDRLADAGYRSVSVANKYAQAQYINRGMAQADAVDALYLAVREQVETNGRFDSGKPVRGNRGDVSYGQRDLVVKDFLSMQNAEGYTTPFLAHGISIAWDALDRDGKRLFNLKQRTPEVSTSPNRIAAVLVCTHDPKTGLRREHNGQPWGINFIVRRIIGLNGMMRGTGTLSPGNPMRAVLRVLGRRWGDKVDAHERSQMDKYVKVLIREFQKYPHI